MQDLEVVFRQIKIQEEVGELSSAILNKLNVPNKSSSSQGNVLEEGVDVIMCVLDVLFTFGHTESDIQKMITTKNAKWEEKLKKATTSKD